MTETQARISLWGVEVFIATAEERSISAAARRLGASPSSVSQQLSNLETALGAILLNRRERPVMLTPAGEMFRRRAQNMLNEAEQAKSEMARMDHRPLTQLRLGMIEDFDAGVTPQLLSQLASEMTSTRFLLETGPSHRCAFAWHTVEWTKNRNNRADRVFLFPVVQTAELGRRRHHDY